LGEIQSIFELEKEPPWSAIMKPLTVSEDIIPLGQFKAQAASIIKSLRERGNALVITQNGRPACVVMSPAEFDLMRERQSFLEVVADGLADREAGRVINDDELERELDAEFGLLEAE
jgi:prevent-host-death family protein